MLFRLSSVLGSQCFAEPRSSATSQYNSSIHSRFSFQATRTSVRELSTTYSSCSLSANKPCHSRAIFGSRVRYLLSLRYKPNGGHCRCIKPSAWAFRTHPERYLHFNFAHDNYLLGSRGPSIFAPRLRAYSIEMGGQCGGDWDLFLGDRSLQGGRINAERGSDIPSQRPLWL